MRPTVEQLVRDHVGLAFALAAGFYLPGGDRDDVQQEALIGLYLAARAYVPGETPFRGFAALVIRRRLGTALKLALRQKHRPLNSAARPITVDGDVLDPADGAYHPASIDTLQRVIDRENVAELRQRIPSLTELERVAVAGYVNGYGAFWIGGRGGQNRRAHRVVYELVNGAIHEGLELDHLCRVRHCVNPAHLEPVTRGENLRRGPRVTLARLRCPRGHDLTDDNSYLEATGYRRCRLCERARARRRREAMKSRMEMTR